MDRLKAMETFVEVARCGSLARAARELRISRPLVSLHLKQIEAQLGARLINRTSRQFSLTEVGVEYLDFCRSILNQMREREAQISQFHGSPRGTLRILSSLAFGNYVLAPIAAEFMREHPEISITLIVTDNYVTRRQLADQTFDLAFVMDRVEDSATSVTTSVGVVQWLPCASPAYLAAHEDITKPDDLVRHNCLSHRSFNPPDVWRLRENGEARDVAVRGSLFSNSVVVLRAGALAGLGIAMLPLYCVEDDLAAGRLSAILPGCEGPPKPAYAIYPHPLMPQKSRAFVEFCRRSMRRPG